MSLYTANNIHYVNYDFIYGLLSECVHVLQKLFIVGRGIHGAPIIPSGSQRIALRMGV